MPFALQGGDSSLALDQWGQGALRTACSLGSLSCLSLLQSLGLSLGVLGLRRPSTLFPWRRAPTLGRVRRAWVIPPISVSENHKRLPYTLVQVSRRGSSGLSRSWLSPSTHLGPRRCVL